MLPLLPVITRHIIIVVVAIMKKANIMMPQVWGKTFMVMMINTTGTTGIRRHIWYDSRDVTMERLVTTSHDMYIHHSPAMIPKRRRRRRKKKKKLYSLAIALHHHYSNLA